MLANPFEQGDHPGVAAHLCHGLHLVDADVHGGLASIQDHFVCRHNPGHQVEHLIITWQSLLITRQIGVIREGLDLIFVMRQTGMGYTVSE